MRAPKLKHALTNLKTFFSQCELIAFVQKRFPTPKAVDMLIRKERKQERKERKEQGVSNVKS